MAGSGSVFGVDIYSPGAGASKGHEFIYAARLCTILSSDVDIRLWTSRGFEDRYLQSHVSMPPFGVIECFAPTPEKERFHRLGVMGPPIWGISRLRHERHRLRRFEEVIPDQRIVHFHSVDPLALVGSRFLGTRSTVPVVVNLHAADFDVLSVARTSFAKAAYKTCLRAFLKRLVRCVDAICVHGEEIAVRIRSRLPDTADKIFVVPYGTDAAPTSSDAGRGNGRVDRLARCGGVPRILFFGMIRREKRLDVLVRAFDLLRQRGVHATLSIVGDPREVTAESVRRLVASARFSQDITTDLRYVGEGEIEALYTHSDVLALPYDASHMAQSGPLNLAATYRLPVVASEVGEIGSFVRRNGIGLTFLTNDEQSLADAMVETLTASDDQRSVWRHNLENLSATLSWENMAAQYLKIYRTLAARR
jgi:glycosyltransferase involved in cell wall biosynthesis